MSYFGSIYADMELPHRAKTVYMYLKDRSNAGNTCWRHGFLERTNRRRPNGSLTSSLYRIK